LSTTKRADMEYETIERFIHQRCAGYHGMFS